MRLLAFRRTSEYRITYIIRKCSAHTRAVNRSLSPRVPVPRSRSCLHRSIDRGFSRIVPLECGSDGEMRRRRESRKSGSVPITRARPGRPMWYTHAHTVSSRCAVQRCTATRRCGAARCTRQRRVERCNNEPLFTDYFFFPFFLSFSPFLLPPADGLYLENYLLEYVLSMKLASSTRHALDSLVSLSPPFPLLSLSLSIFLRHCRPAGISFWDR